MLSIEDASMLTDLERDEGEEPCPRKVVDDARTIYTSRGFRHPKDGQWGIPVLCDFGEARLGGKAPRLDPAQSISGAGSHV